MTDASSFWCPQALSPIVWWSYLAGKLGADLEFDRPFLACIRGLSLGAATTHPITVRHDYPDTGIFVYRSGVQLFPMSSVPYQVDSKASPDVDGDGRGDVAYIVPGRYLLTDKGIQPYPVFILTNPDGTGNIKCTRNREHDANLEGDAPGKDAVAILLHTGMDGLKLNPPSAHTFSIGCQTASVGWLNLLRAKAQITGGGVIDYVLVSADEAIEIMRNSPYLREPSPENVA